MPNNPVEKPEARLDSARRNLMIQSLGILGGAALLKGCGSNGEDASLAAGPAGPDDIAVTSQALTGATSVVWFDSYAELRGKKGGTTTSSVNVAFGRDLTQGGQFSWSTDTTSADDGATIIVPTGTRTGCWKRVAVFEFAFNTYAQLRALTGAGTACVAFGLDLVIGGLFSWTSDATTADNNGTVIVPTATPRTGCWKRVFEGPLHATWFGLFSNPGNTGQAGTNRAALQGAINVAISSKLPLQVPAGFYWLDGTINIGPVAGLRIIGAGPDVARSAGTYFAWAGPSTAQTPMFDLKSVAESEFRNFSILSDVNRPLAIGIRAYNGAVAGQATPGRNTFEKITMQGTNGGLGKGFEFSCYLPGSVDANNENNVFLNCMVFNFTVAAWSFEAGQCKSNTMQHCDIVGISPTQSLYGVTNALSGGYGGSFRWFGGGVSYVGVCFAFSAPGDDTLIHGVNSEGSGRLLTSGFNGAVGPLTVQSVRFACNGLAADKRIIDFASPGPLHLLSCVFEDAPAGNGYIFAKQAPGNPGQLIAIGNAICTNVEPFQFAGDVRRTLIGNTRSNYADATPYYFSDVMATPAGSTRPTSPTIGQTFFDTSLNKPIWCKSVTPTVVWVDAIGTSV